MQPQAIISHNWSNSASQLSQIGAGLDFCEFGGGGLEKATISIRRRMPDGQVIDVITHSDLQEATEMKGFVEYLKTSNVEMIVMTPTCSTIQNTPYHKWIEHFPREQHYLKVCGLIATHQRNANKQFVCLLPHPSWANEVPEWKEIATTTPTMQVGRNQVTTNASAIIEQLNKTEVHFAEEPNSAKAKWSFPIIEAVVEHLWQQAHVQSAFPSVGTDPDSRQLSGGAGSSSAIPTPKKKSGCPGCNWGMASTRREHNRKPDECRYPLVEPEPEWKCVGCKRLPARQRGHADHSEVHGECRWASVNQRNRGRGNVHPREARAPAPPDVNADLPGPALNADDAAPAAPSPDILEAPEVNVRSAQGRGPDRGARNLQPRIVDRAVGENPTDWTSFDISRSLRLLRNGDPAQQQREIRKLHLRWWHGTRKQMETSLGAAGAPQRALDMIPDVIEKCRECRAWSRPRPHRRQ